MGMFDEVQAWGELPRRVPRDRWCKVVCYVVKDSSMLVFKHRDVPVLGTGLQVPIGTVELGEKPSGAAVREVEEETGVEAVAVHSLGADGYASLHFSEAPRWVGRGAAVQNTGNRRRRAPLTGNLCVSNASGSR